MRDKVYTIANDCECWWLARGWQKMVATIKSDCDVETPKSHFGLVLVWFCRRTKLHDHSPGSQSNDFLQLHHSWAILSRRFFRNGVLWYLEEVGWLAGWLQKLLAWALGATIANWQKRAWADRRCTAVACSTICSIKPALLPNHIDIPG